MLKLAKHLSRTDGLRVSPLSSGMFVTIGGLYLCESACLEKMADDMKCKVFLAEESNLAARK